MTTVRPGRAAAAARTLSSSRERAAACCVSFKFPINAQLEPNPPRAEAPYDDQEDANTREGTGEVIEEANLPDGPEASAALAVPGMGQGRACVKSDEDGPC